MAKTINELAKLRRCAGFMETEGFKGLQTQSQGEGGKEES